LLDIIVFGRNAGKYAAAQAKTVQPGTATLAHLDRFMAQRAEAGVESDKVSPQLLPDYARKF